MSVPASAVELVKEPNLAIPINLATPDIAASVQRQLVLTQPQLIMLQGLRTWRVVEMLALPIQSVVVSSLMRLQVPALVVLAQEAPQAIVDAGLPRVAGELPGQLLERPHHADQTHSATQRMDHSTLTVNTMKGISTDVSPRLVLL